MIITYRRTGGLFALLTLAAMTLAAAILTVAVAAGLLLAALGIAAVARLARALLPTSWRVSTVSGPASWPRETIEATLVNPSGSPDPRDPSSDELQQRMTIG